MHRCVLATWHCPPTLLSFSSRRLFSKEASSRIRNLGLVAHIDAGKTTTTERMLYYSGKTSTMGEVHEGDTVMDWMAAERERGISITAASAAIDWRHHRLNLIDTPGHVDFTFEVERSLSVLDGAVIILDGSAGVQAQTLKVWQQANRYQLPRLIYLNKMDKPGASVEKCLDSIRRRLASEPLQLQLPLSVDGHFNGLIDIVAGRCFVWPADHNLSEDGKRFNVEYLLPGAESSTTEPILDASTRARCTEQLLSARERLIGQLADLDGDLADSVLATDQLSSIAASAIHRAVRQATLHRTAVPLLLGSSYRNIGVQPLLDAVVHYLPSPLEAERARSIHKAAGDSFCALAFKIATDRRLGPLTYLRIYSGALPVTGQTVHNLNRDVTEKIIRVYRPFADHFVDLSKSASPTIGSQTAADQTVTLGDIVVVSGLSATITGDTLVADTKTTSGPDALSSMSFAGIEVPEPVYYCSLEAPSLSKMKQLELALEQLQREDPSFKVVLSDGDRDRGASSNQMVIKGMGELHIDIIKDRIRREHGIEVHTGPLQIAYRESITEPTLETVDLSRTIGSVSNSVRLSLELRPSAASSDSAGAQLRRKDIHVKVVNTRENNLAGQLRPWHLKWIHAGVYKAFEYGPLFGFPVLNVEVLLHEFTTTKRTSEAFVTNAVTQCTLEALRQSAPILLEPIMRLEISTPEAYLGPILSDLSARRCEFDGDVASSGDDSQRTLVVLVPLSELFNYSTVLRSLSSGMASFDMALHSYRTMDQSQTDRAIRAISGVD